MPKHHSVAVFPALIALTLTAPFSHAATLLPHAGVVAGTGYYGGAKVCLDLNGNSRCDANEPSTTTDAKGQFSLTAGLAPLVAEVKVGDSLTNPASGVTTPVTRALTLRAPVGATTISPLSTELLALTEANGGNLLLAASVLANRLGVSTAQLKANSLTETVSSIQSALLAENEQLLDRIAYATAETATGGDRAKALRNRLVLDNIRNVVVIYAENHSFDNLFGKFPGANGLNTSTAKAIKQHDRDFTTAFDKLPPAWGGLTAAGEPITVTQAQTTNVWPNAPFEINSPVASYGYPVLNTSIRTRDLYHRFFENEMQINGGANDMFAAFGDSGGLVMGYYDNSNSALWHLAKQYTLADNFFQAAFGGSFLNHQYLICACAPTVPASVVSANKMSINVLDTPHNGVPQLARNASMTASALDGAPSLKTGNIAPLDYFGTGDGYRAVNTMQPAYQPSGNAPASTASADLPYAKPSAATTLPAQTQTTIGDLLSAKGVDWAWYAGGWAAASATPYPVNGSGFGTSTTIYNTNSAGTADATHSDFQAHHQPFNYYASMDPVSHADARAKHLKDRADLLSQAASGTLPAVAFYKPVGTDNQHPGYANVSDGDAEIATIVNALKQSPQWGHMLVVVTYDEFGGQFDHLAVPKGDLLGPGTRIPAVLISPFAKKGFVDHTPYDTGSVLRFITHRWSLPVLAGLKQRDDAVTASMGKPMGDLTNALTLFGY